MGGKPRVDRPPINSGRESMKAASVGMSREKGRRYDIAQTLKSCRKDEAEQGAKAALGGKYCRGGIAEGASQPTTGTDPGAEVAGDNNSKKRRARVSCAEDQFQARELMAQDYPAPLVATRLVMSWPSLHSRKQTQGTGVIKPTTSRSWWRVEGSLRMGIGE
jgi:hypothetical protein